MLFCLLGLIPLTSTLTFETKTPYDYIRGDITTAEWDSTLVPRGIYLIARHGSRHLGESKAAGMTAMVEELLANGGLPWMDGWQVPEYVPDENLVPQGMLEHFNFGKRVKERFETLFPAYYPSTYDIKVTEYDRTMQSAYSFMEGLLERTGPLDNQSTADNISWTGYQPISQHVDNTLLRFMDNCPNIDDQDALAEDMYAAWEKSEVVQKGQVEVSQRIGRNLTVDEIKDLYYLCAFENISPTEANFSQFCELIPEWFFRPLQVGFQIKRVMASSYPNPTTPLISCGILQDAITSLSVNPAKVYLRFAHSETILPLVTFMDVYRDQEDIWLDKAGGFLNLSLADSFANNLIFVMFESGSTGEEVIKVYANEKEVTVPACTSTNNGCTFAELQALVDSAGPGGCNRTELCGLETAAPDTIEDTTTVDQAAMEEALLAGGEMILDVHLFVVMLVVCGIAVLLTGFLCINCRKLTSGRMKRSPGGYEEMPLYRD